MLAHFDAVGMLPIWTLWGKENYCMIANHSIPVIVDPLKAYHAIKTTLVPKGNEKADLAVYTRFGYLPSDIVKMEAVSKTLEFTYDDWCAAQMAKALNKMEDYQFFMRRSGFYANLFDPATGFMRGKNSDGRWVQPFDPLRISHAYSTGGDYTEGNAWQYTWHVQHDIPGLINLSGGKAKFAQKLDSLFVIQPRSTDPVVSDVTGLIGQYAHGTEPPHSIPLQFRRSAMENPEAHS